MRQTDMIKEGFFQAVMLGRGDRIKVGSDVILSGKIWIGSEAVRIGIADALGGETDAFNKAAELAQVKNYKTVDLLKLTSAANPSAPFFAQSPDGVTLSYPIEPGTYMLFIPQYPVKQ
jgi:protease-4